ncbi:DNA polymerase III subunit beta [Candidatus Kaiserbacteria bacterium]|nr:DNA polymerase III subunit beta [Candidatus Kaiserbacteria bacterium]
MFVSINRKVFSDAVLIAARFAERRAATLPVLSCLLFVASDEGIKLRATNLETAVDLKVKGVCKSKGVVAVPATVLQQIASSLTGEGDITLEHTGDTLTLKSGSSKSSLKTLPYDDFPSIPFPESSKSRLLLSGMVLKSLLSSLVSCSSPSTVRPELASVYLSAEGGVLTAVATDSFRLAEKKIPLPGRGTQGKLLIPAKNAAEIAQVLPDEEVIVSFDEHQCAFVGSYGMFVTRLTNATFPDYRQIIPKESVAEAIVLRKDFETALRRTTIFADSFQKVKIGFEPKTKKLSLYARNIDLGESSESIPAQVSGNALELSFNHRYLSASLSLAQSESISLTAAGAGRPVLVRGVGDSSLLYLVSPMNQ